MGDFQSCQMSILKRFGMEEGAMYYVISGCRSWIIDRHGMKHPWSDPRSLPPGSKRLASHCGEHVFVATVLC